MKLTRLMTVCGVASALLLNAGSAFAQNDNGNGGPGGRQGRGNFDPAQMMERMMDNYREQLEFKEGAEWDAVKPLVEKVTEARRETMMGGMGGFGMMGRGGRGGPGGQGGPGGRQGRGGFGGEPSAEATALQKAIDDNAPAAEIKAALAKFVAAKKVKADALVAAQDNLRKVLTVKQEAKATLMGLLN